MLYSINQKDFQSTTRLLKYSLAAALCASVRESDFTTFRCCGGEAGLCGRLQAIQEVVDFLPELNQLPAQVLHLTGLQGPRLTVH